MSLNDDFQPLERRFRLRPQEELRNLDAFEEQRRPQGPSAAPYVLSMLVVAERSARSVIRLTTEVLGAVLRQQLEGTWPETSEWREILPAWFVEKAAPELPIETTPPPRLHWWHLLRRAPAIDQGGPWSLGNWLPWLRPENRTWYWLSADVVSTTEARVWLGAEDSVVLLGALRWMLECAGARGLKMEGQAPYDLA